MSDKVSKQQRSLNMSQIRSQDTTPEIIVRSVLHRLGFRFRKNVNGLSGKPDIVLPKYKTVIFVHGCFWHQHRKCKRSTVPKSNVEYWKPKLAGNTRRDKQHSIELQSLGWKVAVIWECEIKGTEKLIKKINRLFS